MAMRISLPMIIPVMRRAVKSLIESHPRAGGLREAANEKEAIAKVKKLKPDVAILDFSMD